MEFLGHIGIDPKLVLAQIVNFLVLVLVLRLLLYKPLLAIFKKRKEANEKLEQELAALGKKATEAEAASRAKILDAEGRASEIITKAQKTIAAFTDDAVAKNQEYLDGMLRETKGRLEGAKSELAKLSREAVSEQASSLAAKFLSEKLRKELHLALVHEAIRNFGELGSREEDIAFKGTITVQTAYAFPGNLERELRHLIQKKFGKKLSVTVEEEPGLKAGLVIRWGGYELDGSLRGALAARQVQGES